MRSSQKIEMHHHCIAVISFVVIIVVALTPSEANPIYRPSEWKKSLNDETKDGTNTDYKDITAIKRSPTSGFSVGLMLMLLRAELERAASEREMEEKQRDINIYRQNAELMEEIGRRRRSVEEKYQK
ncbi:uncharacterized protein LOC144343270 [Saccoglossus kowalevskii]